VSGLAVGVDAGAARPVEAVVGLVSVPVGRLTVGVGVVDIVTVAIPLLDVVGNAVGTRRGPVPDWGTTRVATMVECVSGAALAIPTHML
jgi:hypothetical protein